MPHDEPQKGNLPTTNKAPTGHGKGQQGRSGQAVTYPYCFIANEALHSKLEAVRRDRRSGKADTVRMLVHMGLKVYEDNHAAGITTHKAAAQQATRHSSEAQAEGQRLDAIMRRKRETPGEQAATLLLVDDR